MSFNLIVFDFDGTIANTSPLIFASINAVAKKFLGKTFTPQEIIAMYGPTEEQIIASLVRPDDYNAAITEFYSVYAGKPELVESFPGFSEFLQQAKQKNITLGIFTGKGRKTCLINLHELGYQEYFDYIYTGDDVKNRKPHPEALLKIIADANVDPELAIYIGDSVADITCARAAGIKFGAAFWDPLADKRILDMRPDFIFYTIEELKVLLY
ncbi:MAG: HAD family hydrolase [bacterium]|nr:HAD family hydrolase [bacterium]